MQRQGLNCVNVAVRPESVGDESRMSDREIGYRHPPGVRRVGLVLAGESTKRKQRDKLVLSQLLRTFREDLLFNMGS